jgi:hypothetical protein
MHGVVVEDLPSDGAEPHVCIGRLLAQRYDPLLREPLPVPMLALLVQIEDRESRERTRSMHCGDDVSDSVSDAGNLLQQTFGDQILSGSASAARLCAARA